MPNNFTLTLDTMAPSITLGSITGNEAGGSLSIEYVSTEPLVTATVILPDGRSVTLTINPATLDGLLPVDTPDGEAFLRVTDDVGNYVLIGFHVTGVAPGSTPCDPLFSRCLPSLLVLPRNPGFYTPEAPDFAYDEGPGPRGPQGFTGSQGPTGDPNDPILLPASDPGDDLVWFAYGTATDWYTPPFETSQPDPPSSAGCRLVFRRENTIIRFRGTCYSVAGEPILRLPSGFTPEVPEGGAGGDFATGITVSNVAGVLVYTPCVLYVRGGVLYRNYGDPNGAKLTYGFERFSWPCRDVDEPSPLPASPIGTGVGVYGGDDDE